MGPGRFFMRLRRVVFCLFLLLGPSAGADTIHVLQPGETLYSVARRYGVQLETLLADNGIDASSVTKVRSGTKLTVKDGSGAEGRSTVTHTVEKDETLWSIARRYDTEVAEILAANPGVRAGKLYVGAKLRVPAASPKTSPPAATEAPVPPKVSAAPTPSIPVPASAQGELWPHSGPRTAVTDGHFQHTKITGKTGDPVAAVAGGRVTWVSPYRGYGNVVIIETRAADARDTYQFLYAGVDEVYVRAGDWVEKGATIARMGADGSTGKGQVLFAVVCQGNQVVDHTRMSWQ